MSINIKDGTDVQTRGDLQNLVTSVIFRQIGWFDEKDVVEEAKKRLNTSEFWNFSDEKLLKEIVEKTLPVLAYPGNGIIERENGKYKISDMIAIG